jgi:thiamine-phosphate diphosphorylase/hydroxyethylthiazole kinase
MSRSSDRLLNTPCYRVLVLTVASEIVAKRPEVKGPGTFLPALIDGLAGVSAQDVRSHAKVTIY